MSSRAAVVAEAMTWIGTPYHHHGRVKGVGVDCAQILCAVYEACGLIDRVEPGAYARDWHVHNREELYLHWLEKVGAREVDVGQPGDVAVFKFGRTWSHGSVLMEGARVVHSYIKRGVILTRLSEEPLAGHAPRFFTLDGLN